VVVARIRLMMRAFFIYLHQRDRVQMTVQLAMLPVTTFPGWEGAGRAGG